MFSFKHTLLVVLAALFCSSSIAQSSQLRLRTNSLSELISKSNAQFQVKWSNPISTEAYKIGSFSNYSLSKKLSIASSRKPIQVNPITRIDDMRFLTELADSNSSASEKIPFFKNKRNLYSSLWAYASLNYLYADLVGLMDANNLTQYQNGEVNGIKITPEFLTSAAVLMQVPLANVFLPHVIKNDRTLKWVQIASGVFMTAIQASTLFVGKPTPYYATFSTFEIATTAFITIDAINWNPLSKNKRRKQ